MKITTVHGKIPVTCVFFFFFVPLKNKTFKLKLGQRKEDQIARLGNRNSTLLNLSALRFGKKKKTIFSKKEVLIIKTKRSLMESAETLEKILCPVTHKVCCYADEDRRSSRNIKPLFTQGSLRIRKYTRRSVLNDGRRLGQTERDSRRIL